MESKSTRISQPVLSQLSGGVGRPTSPRSSYIRDGQKARPVEADGVARHSMRQPIVWITNQGAHNYEAAERYGRLIPLTTGSVNNFQLERLVMLVAPRLQSAHEDDYLLISGSPIVNGVIVALWIHRFGKANILQFSSRGGPSYVLCPLSAETMDRFLYPEKATA